MTEVEKLKAEVERLKMELTAVKENRDEWRQAAREAIKLRDAFVNLCWRLEP